MRGWAIERTQLTQARADSKQPASQAKRGASGYGESDDRGNNGNNGSLRTKTKANKLHRLGAVHAEFLRNAQADAQKDLVDSVGPHRHLPAFSKTTGNGRRVSESQAESLIEWRTTPCIRVPRRHGRRNNKRACVRRCNRRPTPRSTPRLGRHANTMRAALHTNQSLSLVSVYS